MINLSKIIFGIEEGFKWTETYRLSVLFLSAQIHLVDKQIQDFCDPNTVSIYKNIIHIGL